MRKRKVLSAEDRAYVNFLRLLELGISTEVPEYGVSPEMSKACPLILDPELTLDERIQVKKFGDAFLEQLKKSVDPQAVREVRALIQKEKRLHKHPVHLFTRRKQKPAG